MAHFHPFPWLVELFNKDHQYKLQSYQLVDALIMDLHRSIVDGIHAAMAIDLARSIFGIQRIDLFKGPQWVNSEQFLFAYARCLTG